ncbi:MAG: TPM domain-containing protein [Oscillospiraceae bacterium]|nr:TPM domain-containing protein [Oscillospiraceae bacterium]
MKNIAKSFLIFVLALCLSVSVLALTTDAVSGKYEAVSCIGDDDGETYRCEGDYIYLDSNGSGEISFSGDLYDISWDVDGKEIFGCDEDDYSFFGEFSGNELSLSYAGYSYVFVPAEEETGADSNTVVKGGSSDGAFSSDDKNASSPSASSPAPSGDEFNFAYYDKIFRDLPYVTDFAGILSEDEVDELSVWAEDISENYDVYVYIMTVKDMKDFGAWDIEDFTEGLRIGYAPGYGEDGDMIILAMSMAERDYDLAVWGEKGHNAFRDFGMDRIENSFLDNFKENDWMGGFKDYLKQCEKLLRLESQGKPLDINTTPAYYIGSVAAALLIGWLIALLFAKGIKSGMKAPGLKKEANAYITSGGSQITYRSDNYSHVTESRTYSPRQSSSSGGGGGGRSSSGGSHHSGKF